MKTIMKLYIPLICAALLLSCNKKQWKETVSTEITGEAVNTTISWGQNELVIDTIIINIESTTLNGNRIQAEGINLSNSINQQFILTPNNEVSISSYAIPQGTYETFLLTSKFGSTASSIIIKGNYHQQGGNNKVVRLELDYNEYLLNDLVENGSNPISIVKENPGTIVLQFDPDILFDNLNPSAWNAANTSNIGGENGIAISSSSNSDLYNQITPKIGESISFTYE